ncbi:hypothetical protein H9Q08_17550 [Chryseobacterium sp. PS-8]|uniref:Addiction module component n=1 Tax=Chryseobacterium indicum TaxID=2766954 RepID=A0ABS9C941_9FLAO|nr:hypothetical protein [Chryseobacterium sp. PS-8]MCF2221095.1 hypothetical protein [Chryseobacterium sp. PS-8]
MSIDKLAIIQHLIVTEDENTLRAVDSLLADDGLSKIPDSLYHELLQSWQNIESGTEATRERSEIKKDLVQMEFQ